MGSEIDIETYTRDEVYKNLIAIEEHLKKFSETPKFCISCLGKHCAYLQILCEECEPAGCKLNPIYKEIKTYSVELKNSLASINQEKVDILLKQTRDFRKKMEIEENLGHLQEA